MARVCPLPGTAGGSWGRAMSSVWVMLKWHLMVTWKDTLEISINAERVKANVYCSVFYFHKGEGAHSYADTKHCSKVCIVTYWFMQTCIHFCSYCNVSCCSIFVSIQWSLCTPCLAAVGQRLISWGPIHKHAFSVLMRSQHSVHQSLWTEIRKLWHTSVETLVLFEQIKKIWSVCIGLSFIWCHWGSLEHKREQL